MSAENKKSKYLLHVIVMFVIMFGFRLLPAPAPVTAYGMAMFGIFFALIYGWTFLDLLTPSLLGALALATTQYGNLTAVFTAMFSNQNVHMMILGMLAFGAIQETGAGDWILSRILGSKLTKKSAMAMIMVFFLVFFLGNMCGLFFFLMFGVLPLMSKMLLKCGYEKGDKLTFFFIGGCIYFTLLAGAFFPFKGYPLVPVGAITASTQQAVSYPGYMAITAGMSVLSFIGWPLIMKLFRCDLTKLATVDVSATFPQAEGNLSARQKASVISILVFITVLMTVTLFSSKHPILTLINSTYGVLGMMAILWFVITIVKIDGEPILNMKKAAMGFQWDMLILIAVALTVSGALTAEGTGISKWMSGFLVPMFAGKSPLLFFMVMATLLTIITNLGNNIAVCMVFASISGVMVNNGMNYDIAAIAAILAVCSSATAMMTPAASINGAILHATECMTPGVIYKYCPVMMVFSLIILAIVLVPYMMFV